MVAGSNLGESIFFDLMGGGGYGLGIDEKFIPREQNRCTPNYFFQKIHCPFFGFSTLISNFRPSLKKTSQRLRPL